MADNAGDFAPLSEIKDEKQRVQKFKQWFKQSHDASEEWRLKAIESYQFVGNVQWTEEDRARLTAQRRPVITINKILAPVLFMGGVQRQQRVKATLIPFESDDARPAELMNALLEYVGNCSRERKIDSQVFIDKVITGMGFWKCGLDFDRDPEGELKWERLLPLSVFWDPNAFDNGWETSEYIIQANWWNLDAAKAQWPEYKDEIRRQFGEWIGGESASGTNANLAASGEMAGDSLSDKRLFWDAQTQRIRVLEIWYAQRTPVTVVFNEETKDVTADPEAVDAARQALKANPSMRDTVKLHKRSVKTIHVARVMNSVLLDDELSPYRPNTFPIFPALGYYFWRQPFGMVEPMKDPQREKNKRRSTIIEMVQRMPHSGFLNQRTGGAKNEDIEKFATGNGAVINYDSVPPMPIPPPDLPQTLVWLDTRNDAEVRDVVNITNELLGNNTQRTVSGRAIEARQRSGSVTQEPMLDGFEEEKEPAVRFMIELIQQFTSLGKAARILGSIGRRSPNSPAAQLQAKTPDVELIQLLSDAFEQKYDVEIRSTPADSSQNRAKWQTIAELLQQFQGEVPPKVVCEALRDAGLITESQMTEILAFQEQKMAMEAQAAQGQGGGGPPQAPAPPGATLQ